MYVVACTVLARRARRLGLVLDSTADIRYLVIPRRPPGTAGLSGDELAELVTRDSMIGVADPAAPAATVM